MSNVLNWEQLTKCTSRGKNWLPDGAELVHLGGNYTVEKKGRKKNVELTATTVKSRTVGGKGTKVCNLDEVV